MTGKVWLVGAGPGDPGLLTLRARECLEQADVVLHDRLVTPEVLYYAHRCGAELIDVGKEPTRHAHTQEEIHQLMIRLARAGKKVVRLKGGDPLLFGRATEELRALKQAGIPYAIVPGVSSALAAPAYAGIPLTDRNDSHSFVVVTGHQRQPDSVAPPLEEVDWKALANSVSTLVILMGMTRLAWIVEELIGAGRERSTPVAVIQWGTTNRQKTVIGTLDDIVRKVADAGVSNPAVVVVGKIARLGELLTWWEVRPLFGKRVLITRPAGRADKLGRFLWEAGAEVEYLPLIEIRSLPPTPEVLEAVRRLHRYRWVVLTSAHAVDALWGLIRGEGLDARSLAGAKIAAVGPETAARLEGRGLFADFIPEDSRARALVEPLLRLTEPGDRIFFPAGNLALERGWWQPWIAAGRRVDALPIYRTAPAEIQTEARYRLCRRLEEGWFHAVTLTSPSTVDQWVHCLGGPDRARALCRRVALACIGQTTAARAKHHGLDVQVIAKESTAEGLVRSLIEWIQEGWHEFSERTAETLETD